MIPANDSKKLVRGLKDISNLFHDSQPLMPETTPAVSRLQVLSVLCPDAPSLSLILNTRIASHFAQSINPLPLISIEDGKFVNAPHNHSHDPNEKRLKHLVMSLEAFTDLCLKDSDKETFGYRTPYLFLSFDQTRDLSADKLYPVIDKLIIYVRPLLRSITESYKLIKQSFSRNKNIDFFLLFDGAQDDPRGKIIFEKISSMASHHLSTHMYWLGNLKFMKTIEGDPADNLAWDYLMFDQKREIVCPEKMGLENFFLDKTDAAWVLR